MYDEAYESTPNWEIGRPQRAFVELAEAGHIRSPVLDVGCGTGELSLFLAGRGHDVLGIDISPVAVEHAREKARSRRSSARFVVWDALALPALASAGIVARTVVDSAMFHLLGDRERQGFVAALARTVLPGGAYWVLGDAAEGQRPGYGITPGEIVARFARVGWSIISAKRTIFERRQSVNDAYLVGVRKPAGGGGV